VAKNWEREQAHAKETPVTSEIAELRFNSRFTLRALMGVVAGVGLFLAIFVTNARMRVDWANPRIDDLTVAAFLTVSEAVVFYYCVLVTVIARGLINRAKRVRRVRRIWIYGPVILIVAVVAILQVLDVVTRGP
jgi:uncharacterized membrane protein